MGSRAKSSTQRSLRFKILSLVLIPLTTLVVLWAFATTITLGAGIDLLNVETVQAHFGYPSGALGSALQRERRLSMVGLEDKTAGPSLGSQRLRTDRQAALFLRLSGDQDALEAAGPQARQRVEQVRERLGGLDSIRKAVDSRRVDRAQALERYSSTIAAINDLQGSLTTLADPEVTKDAQTLTALARAREILSQEDALLSGAIAAGRLPPPERARFTQLVGAQRHLYEQATTELPPVDRAAYQRIRSGAVLRRLAGLEDKVINEPGRLITDARWKTTADSALTRLRGLELQAIAGAEARAEPIATGIIQRIAIAGLLGLLALGVSITLSIRVGRSVIRELNRLKDNALELAERRLPNVIKRLRGGERVDAASEVPPLSFGTREIDQVGQAFNAARRTAIEGAVDEAALREGIGVVFTDLARRSQALLHRQLTLLDSMESKVSDPDHLQDLFRLDHLSTRMRRHAEGLIILSGAAPGRAWRNPVPVVDVIRGAASEVEDYVRVDVMPMPRLRFAGQAVADVIHMLAELIENATLYSPPQTTVRVNGELVGHGFVVEVEDRGLSMGEEELAAANERLANPPEFDFSTGTRLGLFVVSRLAQRHGVTVTLRANPYGGLTAIVLFPQGIVVEEAALPPGASQREVPPTAPFRDLLEAAPEPARASAPEPGRAPAPAPVPGERPNLPQRVPQESLAPELRDMPADETAIDEKSPEEFRSTLSAMQQGWLRARAEQEK